MQGIEGILTLPMLKYGTEGFAVYANSKITLWQTYPQRGISFGHDIVGHYRKGVTLPMEKES